MKKFIFVASILINVVFGILIIRHFINLPKADPVIGITYFLHRNDVLDKLPIDSNSIIFAGDSHIQQFELAELFHSLKIKNRGIDYDTSLGLLNRISELTNGHPSKIFIEIGSNDIRLNSSENSFAKNIEAILRVINVRSPKSIVYLQSIIPNIYSLQKIISFNKKLKLIASIHHSTFIDLNPYFLGNGLKRQYDSGDGVHLNGEGYLMWRDILKKYL